MAKTPKKKRLPQISTELNQSLLNDAKKSNEEILESLNTSINGLNSEQYEQHRDKYGPNTLGTRKQHQWYHSLFDAFINPFSIILMVIAILDATIPGIRD
jgi:Mg2+-importing ATPase